VIAGLDPALGALLAAAAGLLLGWTFATALRRQDDRTFVFARAPQLPIRALAAHDDAWLRGTVRCEQPLACPWFDVACVAYAYSCEREVKRTRKNSNGKTVTETSWETVRTESRAVAFDLDDGDRVRVALPEARNEAMVGTGHDYETSTLRHSAQVLGIDRVVSVLGVLRDDRTFGPYAKIPLLVTAATRAQRVASATRHEGWLFAFAVGLPFLGAAAAAVLATQRTDALGWLLAVGVAALATVPQWWLLTHNRLVRLRQQVKTAQRQIEVDMAVRFGLVPNLVAVIRSMSAHESDLLTRLSALRSSGSVDADVRGERDALAVSRQVLLLHERHPELRSDALYRDLHERLWAVEEKIAHSRSFYSGVVTEWNDRLAKFPSLLVARACGHRPAPLFAAACAERLPARLT
jgi:LemA protein